MTAITVHKPAACGPPWVPESQIVVVIADRLDTTVEDLVRRCTEFVDKWVANSENSLRACAHDPEMLAAIDQHLREKPTRAANRGSIVLSVAFKFGIESHEALALCVHAGAVPREMSL